LKVTPSGAGIATVRTARSAAPERREKFNFMVITGICLWSGSKSNWNAGKNQSFLEKTKPNQGDALRMME
jgi:hypothetical protein